MQVMLPPKGVITVAITAVIASVITDGLIIHGSIENTINSTVQTELKKYPRH